MTSKEERVDQNGGGTKREEEPSLALLRILDELAANGIEVDKNLRQPTYYSRIEHNELRAESFAIVADLLNSRRLPLWLAQRISWFYMKKFFKQIEQDMSSIMSRAVTNVVESAANGRNGTGQDDNESTWFTREKLVSYLRGSIPSIIKEWLNERDLKSDKNLILFSLKRSIASDQMIFEYGMKNKRRLMEDKVALLEDIDIFCDLAEISSPFHHSKPSRPNAIFGVFDGHCGLEAAQYVSVHLPLYLLQHSGFFKALANPDRSEIENLLVESFDIINAQFSKKALDESIKSGTTGCLCLFTGSQTNDAYERMSVAWCGDTQLCLVKNGSIDFLTETHKPNTKSERERIEKAGGSVCYLSNAWRINGSLAVARSFGDVEYQPSVTARPQVEHITLDSSLHDYVIIGCDGLWEALAMEELCPFIYEKVFESSQTTSNIAESLVKKSREEGSTDNITAIFVTMKTGLRQIAKPIENPDG